MPSGASRWSALVYLKHELETRTVCLHQQPGGGFGLTGLLGAFAEAVVQGSRVLVHEADELALLAVLIKPRHSDQVGTLENTHVCAREIRRMPVSRLRNVMPSANLSIDSAACATGTLH